MIHGASANVLDYGADPTGAADSTAAIQAAVNSKNGFLSVYFPAGTYKITSTITFAYDRYFVYGDGVASKINFVPTANDDCFLFDKGSAVSYQNVIRDLAFYSDDTTYDKRAITIVDVSSCLIENVQTIFPHWSGGSSYSTFLWVQGRDTTAVRGLNVSADVPIRISPIPAPHTASGIGIDQFHFSDCYLLCSKATKAVVQIDSGVNLTHVTFDGYQAWIGGNYGVYWVDTNTIGTSLAFTIKNVRWEQEGGTTGYFIYIDHNYRLQQLLLENLYGASATNGIRLRKVDKVSLKQIFYVGSQVALDVTAECDFINFENVFFNDPASTVSIQSQAHSGTYWLGGNATTFLPESPNGGLVQYINREPNNGYSRLVPKELSLAAGQAKKFCNETAQSLVLIVASNQLSALYQLRGTAHGTILMLGDTTWWGASASAQDFNIYWDAGTSEYLIQNTTGGTVTFSIVTVG
jgi:hypothetical protein